MIRVPGKVILAGEHAAVRGHAAVVTPLLSRSLTLEARDHSEFGVAPGPFREPFLLAMNKALEILGQAPPKKLFTITSDIPARAGLGSSASLSVAITRSLIPSATNQEQFSLALSLEDIFHGKSSGMDVAAALSSGPILFRRGSLSQALPGAWRPHLFLADTTLRSSTKACVEQVTALHRPDLDEQMARAAGEVKMAFAQEDISRLATAFDLAHDCFLQWGLVPEEVAGQRKKLLAAGALAVKPTGSGNGGFLLGLWAEPPAGNLLSVW